jgi:hypothetical protein
MKGNPKNESKHVQVELKYCERCGSLWLREIGAGVVYCESCQKKIEDLPSRTMKRRHPVLPEGPQTVVADYRKEKDCKIEDEEEMQFATAGGVA